MPRTGGNTPSSHLSLQTNDSGPIQPGTLPFPAETELPEHGLKYTPRLQEKGMPPSPYPGTGRHAHSQMKKRR